MLAQASDDGHRFSPQGCGKGIILRIQPAGHGEILPHYQPAAVAFRKEVMILIDVAAPTAQAVDAAVPGQLEDSGDPLLIPGVEGTGRYPVGPRRRHGGR